MTSENNYLPVIAQLVAAWEAIQRATEAALRVKERAQWEEKWASIIAAIDQHNVPQPLEILSRYFLELELDLRQKSDHTFQATIRAHQQRMFAAICVSIVAHGVASESVETLAILAQACMRERESADANERSADFLACQRRVTEALWLKLKPTLIAMVSSRGWVASWGKAGIFDNNLSYRARYSKAETLALMGFGYILENILTPRLDLDRNVAALLTTIAHRGIAKEYRALRGKQTVPLTESVPAEDILAEEILGRIADQQIQDAFWQYVALLKPDEQHIIRCWHDQPPVSSTAIAGELGEGWNENRVNVARHRILKKIRRYLHSLNQDDKN